MKFFIHTTGCKANQWDSYIISNKLRKEGFTPCPLPYADFIIINACTLTGGAERDIKRFINRGRSINEKAKIILAGCHAQVYPDKAFGADIILGQNDKFHIERFLNKEGCFVKSTRAFPMEESIINGLPEGRTRFFFKIQDGCDKFCTYCIVPYARGKSRNRPISEIIEVMKLLKERGIKEVVLTGIEISSYKDLTTGMDLKGLLNLLEKSDTPQRIRISSIDPLYIDREFMKTIAHSKKITKSLHIPLQSGSDRILETMGRKYSKAFIMDTVEMLKKGIEDIGIGMDVMVGFPTEDEDAFLETYRLLDTIDIYYLHIFPYSVRKGANSSSMEDDVPESIKKERAHRLKKLDINKRKVFYNRFMGKKAWIIPEGKVYKGLYMRGYTDNYIPIYIPYKKGLENNLTEVTIKGIHDNMVIGETSKQCAATPYFFKSAYFLLSTIFGG
jgi:threonylcarbamoyladenosine tRNA methylthiotransferase MtaB